MVTQYVNCSIHRHNGVYDMIRDKEIINVNVELGSLHCMCTYVAMRIAVCICVYT